MRMNVKCALMILLSCVLLTGCTQNTKWTGRILEREDKVASGRTTLYISVTMQKKLSEKEVIAMFLSYEKEYLEQNKENSENVFPLDYGYALCYDSDNEQNETYKYSYEDGELKKINEADEYIFDSIERHDDEMFAGSEMGS